MTRTLPALALLALSAAPAAAQTVTVTGGKADQVNVVCAARIAAADQWNPTSLALPDKTVVPAQRADAGVLDPKDGSQYLVFVLPKLKAGETVTLVAGPDISGKAPTFRFAPEKGGQADLVLGERKVLSSFHPTHDPEDHYYTFKPFHNVYDPATGKTMLTNTSAKTAKDGQFPHHRGLFFGFNKITYGDKQTADIWHGTDNVYSQRDVTDATEAGHVLGRDRALVSWHGKDGKEFAREMREVTAYAVPGVTGTLIDWSTVLSTKLPKVRLDGDPQHAGFHFRANQEVSKNGKANTYYLRPDGKGKPGETRNWDAKGKNPAAVNLPWNALSFVTGGKRYTVLRVNHPDNPGEARGSERDYGRFGDYFEYDLTPDKPLKLKYRVWVQEGEMTPEQCNAIAAAFVSPPATKVAK